MTKDSRNSTPTNQSLSNIIKPSDDIKKTVDKEILELEAKWGISYDPRAQDMVDGALRNLEILMEEAQKIDSVSSETKNIKELLEDIIAAQESLNIALKYKRLADLHEVSENCKAIRDVAAQGLESPENARIIVNHNNALQQNLKSLQNAPSIEAYEAEIKGFSELVKIQSELTNNSQNSNDLSLKIPAAAIASGLENSYKIARNFNENRSIPAQQNYQLAATSEKVLNSAKDISDKDISISQTKIKNIEDQIKATEANLIGLGKSKESAEKRLEQNNKLETQLKEKRQDLAKTKPSLLSRLSFGLIKDENINEKRKEIAQLRSQLLGINAVKDLGDHILLINKELDKVQNNIKNLQTEKTTLEKELEGKKDIAKKIKDQRENLPQNTAANKTSIEEANKKNTALNNQISEYSKSIINNPNLKYQNIAIENARVEKSSKNLSQQFVEGLQDELDLVRLTRKGLAKTTRVDPRIQAIRAFGASAGYIPIPGASYAATLLLMGAEYLVNKDIKKVEGRIDEQSQIQAMARAIEIVGDRLAKSYGYEGNSPLSHLNEKGVKTFSAFAVTKVIEAMSRDPKNGGLDIPAGATSEQIADIMLTTINQKTKITDSRAVVARSQRGQIRSNLETTKKDTDKNWTAKELLEDCAIITENGEKFISPNAKIGAKYGFRKGTAQEATKQGFVKVENQAISVENKQNLSDEQLVQIAQAKIEEENKSLNNLKSGILERTDLLFKSIDNKNSSDSRNNEVMTKLLRSITNPDATDKSIALAIKNANIGNDPKILESALQLNKLWKENPKVQAEIAQEWDKKYPAIKSEKTQIIAESTEINALKSNVGKSAQNLENEIRNHLKLSKIAETEMEGKTAEIMNILLNRATTEVNNSGIGSENPFRAGKDKVTTEDKEEFKKIVSIDTGKKTLGFEDETKKHFHVVVSQFNALKHDFYEAKKVAPDVNIQTELENAKNNIQENGNSLPRSSSFTMKAGLGALTVLGVAASGHVAATAVTAGLVAGSLAADIVKGRSNSAKNNRDAEALPKAEAVNGSHVERVEARRQAQQEPKETSR